MFPSHQGGPNKLLAWVVLIRCPAPTAAEDCNGLKTRRYENIRAEVEAFFDVHDEMGSVPGGLHLEMTGAQ
jgi:3-deoxy-D-arabino-heptulosonate 7-phosphate (DAHP) synthase class II